MAFVEIVISSTTSSETLFIDSSNPEGPPFSVLPREKDHLYSVEDDNNRLLIMTNLNAKNFKLIQTSLDDSKDKSKWKEIIPHRNNVLLQSFLAFPSNIVVMERKMD